MTPKIFRLISFGAAFLLFILMASVSLAASTAPSTLNYQGRLLDSDGAALSGTYDFRFSIWSDADWVSSDTSGTGAINTAASAYEDWQETHSVTLGSNGIFNLKLGETTTLPTFDSNTHKYLQVEVKADASANTSYEILDPLSTSDTVDRKTINSVPYALNADTLDGADLGTGSGNIAALSSGGIWDISQIPGGTNAESFVIDNDGDGSSISLKFGNDASDFTITFDDATGDVTFATDGGDFSFSNDNITTTGNVSFPDSSQFRIRENSDPATNSACANKGELIYDTTDDELQYCTTTGSAGVAVWTAVDSGGGADFEDVYGSDADKTLTTSNNDLTINAGSGNFYLTSSNITIDGTGNVSVGGTVDGVDLSALGFSDISTRTKREVFVPEFPFSSVEGDGSSNRGILISDFIDSGGSDKRNFYEWNTRQGSLQDIDVVVKYQLPLDFDSFTSAPLSVDYITSDGVTGTNKVDVLLYDTTGTAVSLTGGSDLANSSWTTADITFGGSPTFTAGSTITLHLRLSATSSGWARASNVVLNYNGK